MLDIKIVNLVRDNNSHEALVHLYKGFPAVRKMILSKGGTRADAEDIFQEALIILCRKIKEADFQLTAQISTYLFSVCSYLWKDELKKRNRLPIADFETGLKEYEEKEIAGRLESEDRARLAEKIMNELGERCRELLLLFYNSGLKLKDIAAKMGYSSESTAKNQKYKCLEGAKNKLKELQQTTQTF